MDAALVTRMLNIGYSVSSEPAKDVIIKKDTDFKDVLSKSMNKEETKDVKKEDSKDVEKTEVKDKDNVKEKPKDKKVDEKKDDRKVKDDEEDMTEKVNGLVEKVLENVENNEDVENLEKLKELVGELEVEGLTNEEMLKIQEELKNRMMEKVTEVGPQIVETEETKFDNYEEIKNKLDSLAEKLGISNEDVENKDVNSNEGNEMSDSEEETGFNFAPSDENEGILKHKDVKKESKFNITDLRKNTNVENKIATPDFNVENTDTEIPKVEVTDVQTLMFSRAEKLQEQIDVIKQVSEQIDVKLTEDRSEMVIKLKPDNLGKVTMQISVENGNVVAKFLAESQKVKEILESNMQSLKDHLAKQGMVIQDLSVSVGNENRQQEMFSNRNIREFGRRQGVDKIQTGSYFTEEDVYGADEGNLTSYWPDSTVSFSA